MTSLKSTPAKKPKQLSSYQTELHSVDKRYVSPIDQAMQQFDRTHPRSHSQQAEIDKHARVFVARDKVVKAKNKHTNIWD